MTAATGVRRTAGGAMTRMGVATLALALPMAAARAEGGEVLAALERGDCSMAAEAINRGMERDDAQAYFGAGYLYSSTGCVAEDLPRAARYYQRAVELGSSDARTKLGFLHGMGLDVPQDYRAAYRWYTYPVGALKKEPKPPLPPSHESAYGYARTVQQLAAVRVVYPRRFDSGQEGVLYVTFHTATGALTYASHGSAGDRSQAVQRIQRPSPFMLAIDRAYETALREIPKPADLPAEDLVFEAPWQFQLR